VTFLTPGQADLYNAVLSYEEYASVKLRKFCILYVINVDNAASSVLLKPAEPLVMETPPPIQAKPVVNAVWQVSW
jgi:hypothetical protein